MTPITVMYETARLWLAQGRPDIAVTYLRGVALIAKRCGARAVASQALAAVAILADQHGLPH